jgi:hypothetical protein
MAGPSLDYSQFASNPYGIQVRPLNSDHPDAPTSKTFHGITIEANNAVIGRVQSWNVSGAYSRDGEHVWELNNRTYGRPVDYVPGKATGFSISATIAELWEAEVEIQLGLTAAGTQFNDLIDQTFPFTCREFWFRGPAIYRVWTYRGCWFTGRNEDGYNVDSAAPRVMANLEFNYVSRRLTSGQA